MATAATTTTTHIANAGRRFAMTGESPSPLRVSINRFRVSEKATRKLCRKQTQEGNVNQ